MTATVLPTSVDFAQDPLLPHRPAHRLLIHEPQAVEAIVALLAQGLELIFTRVSDGNSIVRQDANVPQPMQDAQSYIGRLYLEEGKSEGASADLHGLIALCTLPLGAPQWGLEVFAAENCRYRDVVLVDPDLLVPTPECSVIAMSYNGFGENQIVEKILFDTLQALASRFKDREKAYSRLRELLGRHSLISEKHLVNYLNEHDMLSVQQDVAVHFYERLPQAWLVDGMAYSCPHCGTLMKPKKMGQAPRCTMVQCATISFPGKPILLDAKSERYLIAKPPVLKYWTEPAIDELRIYDTARQLNIEDVKLYPYLDAVDISLFAGMEVGIDAKSYTRPEVLAMKFLQSGIGRLAQYKVRIVAINDACVKGAPNYIGRLIDCLQAAGDSNPAKGVRFMTVSDLLERLPTFARSK
jgi:hypothetical protein